MKQTGLTLSVLVVLFALGFCAPANAQDNLTRDAPPRTWVVNLDLPPESRWPLKEMVPFYNASVHEALGMIGQFIPGWLAGPLIDMAAELLPLFGEYAGEISAHAAAFKIPIGQASLLNVIYEIEAGCTSIIAETFNGTLLHGRNLDFNLASVLRKTVIDVDFVRTDKQTGKLRTVYKGTTYVGYVGLLTGMRAGSFSITADERDTGNTLENLLEALFVPGTTAAPFLIRDTLQNVESFEDAIHVLSTTSLAAPIYIIMAGAAPGEGVIITRDRAWAANVWRLDPTANRWYEVETNYDHWKPAGDSRRKTAIAGMEMMGRKNATLPGIYNVLSTSPVLNDQTTYTTLLNPSTGYYSTTIRFLP